MKALLLLAALSLAAPVLPDRPALGRVLDQAGVLTQDGARRIQGVSDELESRAGVQLAVAVVKSLDGEDPADYANKLFRAWGIGHHGQDDGVLILVCPSERKARIEVGYGLEARLPDIVAGRLLKDELHPYFADGRFEDGILMGARRIDEIVSGKPAGGAPPPRPRPRSAGAPPLLLMIPFFSVFVLLGAGAVGSGLGGACAGQPAGGLFMTLWGSIFSGAPLLMARAAAGPGGFYGLVALWLCAAAAAFRWGRAHPGAFKGRFNAGGGFSAGGFGSTGSSGSFGDSGDGGGDFGGGSSGGGGASDSF